MAEDGPSLEDLGLTRRNVLKTTGATALASGVLASSATARNPHCIRKETFAEGPDSNGDLDVCFKVAGLGNEDVCVTVSAIASACYACRNNGGNFPQDPKKQLEETEVKNTVRLTPENGQINSCLTLQEPQTTLDCPGGQNAVLVDVSYTNVRIVVNNVDPNTECDPPGSFVTDCRISGTFSREFITVERAQCD